MSSVSVEDAQSMLLELIHRLSPGEEIVITERDQPVARLIATPAPSRKPRQRQPGSLRGSVLHMAEDFDAPLDESNINRFVKVLDRFIDRSQFIIVTHSKRTMARADVMYGVTMEEFGVSKPVGMRLTQSDTKSEATTAAQKAALRLDG